MRNEHSRANGWLELAYRPQDTVVERLQHHSIEHGRFPGDLDYALLEFARCVAIVNVANVPGAEWHAFEFQVESDLRRLAALHIGLSRLPSQASGIGGDEGEQILQRRYGIKWQRPLHRKRLSHLPRSARLLAKRVRVGIEVDQVTTNFGERQAADLWVEHRRRRGGSRKDACLSRRQGLIVAKNGNAVLGEVDIGFQAGD